MTVFQKQTAQRKLTPAADQEGILLRPHSPFGLAAWQRIAMGLFALILIWAAIAWVVLG